MKNKLDTLSVLSTAFCKKLPDEVREELAKHASVRGLNAEELIDSHRLVYCFGAAQAALCAVTRDGRAQASLNSAILSAALNAAGHCVAPGELSEPELPEAIREFLVGRAFALGVNVAEFLESYRRILILGIYDGTGADRALSGGGAV